MHWMVSFNPYHDNYRINFNPIYASPTATLDKNVGLGAPHVSRLTFIPFAVMETLSLLENTSMFTIRSEKKNPKYIDVPSISMIYPYITSAIVASWGRVYKSHLQNYKFNKII